MIECEHCGEKLLTSPITLSPFSEVAVRISCPRNPATFDLPASALKRSAKVRVPTHHEVRFTVRTLDVGKNE